VDTTIIDGKIVMEGRRLTTVDEQKVLREANAAFLRVLDRIGGGGSSGGGTP
jgi:5-methylthioadenosine/S-adenosylhomocysteine deaminase